MFVLRYQRGILGRDREPHKGPGKSRQIEIGIVGTFDVENYGDLLFPLMAEAAFARRGLSAKLVVFAPNRRSEESWPYRINATTDIPEFLPALSALLIGGGQIIRFDKGYPVPADPSVNLPIAYWLIPAVLGALIGKPVIWNAIGAWTDSPSAPWYDGVVAAVLSASHFVGVRDAASRLHLKNVAPHVPIQLVPDTAFSLSRFWPLEQESREYTNWREALVVDGRYAVIQANHVIGHHGPAIETLMERMGVKKAIALPVCWCHGDRTEGFPQLSGKVIASPDWLAPRLISEIIGRSQLVIASSLHACITSLSYGVPAVRVLGNNAADRKFELLDEFEGVGLIHNAAVLAAIGQRGRKIEPRVVACADRLDWYWDQVVDVVLNPHLHDSKRSMTLMLSWASKIFGDIEVAALARRFGPIKQQGKMHIGN